MADYSQLLFRNDIQVALKKKYNDTHKSSKSLLSGNEWYCHQAFRAVNQAAGIPLPLGFNFFFHFCLEFSVHRLNFFFPNSVLTGFLLCAGRCIRHRFDYGAVILLGRLLDHKFLYLEIIDDFINRRYNHLQIFCIPGLNSVSAKCYLYASWVWSSHLANFSLIFCTFCY